MVLYEEYHPYGTTAYRAANSQVEVSARRYRYTGKEKDEETGLYCHGARYYACWLGRWTAADPIGLGDGVNRFAYVSGNPVRLVDPGGTFASPPEQDVPEFFDTGSSGGEDVSAKFEGDTVKGDAPSETPSSDQGQVGPAEADPASQPELTDADLNERATPELEEKFQEAALGEYEKTLRSIDVANKKFYEDAVNSPANIFGISFIGRYDQLFYERGYGRGDILVDRLKQEFAIVAGKNKDAEPAVRLRGYYDAYREAVANAPTPLLDQAVGAEAAFATMAMASGGALGTRGLGRLGPAKVPRPLRNIPRDASLRVLRPDPNGGAQYGIEYKWVNANGQTVRFRVHGPDPTAPAGSNAASGPTYRVQIGGRFMDVNGKLHPRGVHNPRSPNYDPAAANATHIPFPGIRLPGIR